MSAPEIKGYCPGALRPMRSGDGLVVRIRPFNGHLSQVQAAGIANLSQVHGNGIIDLSSRANVQLRGVTDAGYAPLIDGLRALSLIDPSQASEGRRNVLLTPFRASGDSAERLASQLAKTLMRSEAPDLPSKFGFAVDTGETPVLQTASADIRLECTAEGALLLVADGMPTGKLVQMDESVDAANALSRWFLQTRDDQNRMAQLMKAGAPLPPGFTTPRQNQTYAPTVGPTAQGILAGLAFGQMSASTFATLSRFGDLRLTPWRMILIEGVQTLPPVDGIITDPADPLLRITACTGAPDCAQALASTRPLARRLAGHLRPNQTIHISGCAKGCAYPKPAALTLTASQDGFDLVKQGRAGDTPSATGLSPDDIIKAL